MLTMGDFTFYLYHVVSVCMLERAGVSGTFSIDKVDGRVSDYRVNILQRHGREVRIGLYNSNKDRVILYRGQSYTWADGTGKTPDDRPICGYGDPDCLMACKLFVHSILHWATSLSDLTLAEPIRRSKVRSKYLLKPKSEVISLSESLTWKSMVKYIIRPKSS